MDELQVLILLKLLNLEIYLNYTFHFFRMFTKIGPKSFLRWVDFRLRRFIKTIFKTLLKWTSFQVQFLFKYFNLGIYFNYILNFQGLLIKIKYLFKKFDKFRTIIKNVPKSFLKCFNPTLRRSSKIALK